MLSRPNRFPLRLLARAAILILSTPAWAESTTALFLSGPKDHGRPGRHEYEKDSRALAWCLENAANLGAFDTKVNVGAAPRDLSFYEDVDVIVILSSSDRLEKETHPLFPPDPLTNGRGYDEETKAFLDGLDAMIAEKQIGVVVFHYANWAENWAARGYYMKWIGGLWVQMVSRNPVDDWSMTAEAPQHPILRGIEPWTYRDEMFCRFHLPNDERRTNLLLGTPANDRYEIGPQIASWAYQRDDGGRGFVYGGVDWHENLRVEEYRQFLLNGIVWAAGVEVPEGGVGSAAPEIVVPETE